MGEKNGSRVQKNGSRRKKNGSQIGKDWVAGCKIRVKKVSTFKISSKFVLKGSICQMREAFLKTLGFIRSNYGVMGKAIFSENWLLAALNQSIRVFKGKKREGKEYSERLHLFFVRY